MKFKCSNLKGDNGFYRFRDYHSDTYNCLPKSCKFYSIFLTMSDLSKYQIKPKYIAVTFKMLI